MKNEKSGKPISYVEPTALKQWLHDGREIGVLDVREHGQYGEQHLFYAVNLPYSRLEADVWKLVPNFAARVVLVDEDGLDVSVRSAERLADLGYTNVHVLQGGIQRWIDRGLTVFAGVNVPSKAFGEIAEEVFHTPHISAKDLYQKQQRGEKLVILDGRPFPEYQKMNIPGSVCCPNGELALYIDELVPDEETTVVINCAGRTRSIIGAQTLLNLGIKNPVYALENGTQGWMLADQKLDHGSSRSWKTATLDADLSLRQQRAKRLFEKYQIQTVDQHQVSQWCRDDERTVFLLDIRDPQETLLKGIPGFTNAPGGQLIQATDQYVGVRNARLVLLDTDGVRAPVVASWLWMQGWEVYVMALAEAALTGRKTPASLQAESFKEITADQLNALMALGYQVFDLRPSADYRNMHLENAVWTIRPKLAEALDQSGHPEKLVLIGKDVDTLEIAARDLRRSGVVDITGYTGSMNALKSHGCSIVSTPDKPADQQRIDYLFFVHDRHDGNKEAAKRYLSWELGLVAQLDESEKNVFRISG